MSVRHMGTLSIFMGPMFAGKTRHLLLRIARYQARGKKVLVFKPWVDVRYGTTDVVAHSGERLPAIPVRSWPAIPSDVDVVAFDEVQFFQSPFFSGHLPSLVSLLLETGVDVLASGLWEDWRGEVFPVTQALLAMSNEIVALSARCSVCGGRALRTAKLVGHDGVVDIGGAEKYAPRCDLHWAPRRSEHALYCLSVLSDGKEADVDVFGG